VRHAADLGARLPGRSWSSGLLRCLEGFLFMRPAGTEHVSEGQLAALVSRDAMIDVAVAHVPAEAVH
jgi:hypothetical protein